MRKSGQTGTASRRAAPAASADLDIQATFARALALHRAGNPAARDLYRRILSVEPSRSDALHLNGLLSLQRGDGSTAGRWVRRALVLQPARSPYRNSLGEVLRTQGQGEAALAEYRRAVALDPASPDAYINLLKQTPLGRDSARLLGCWSRLRPVTAPEMSAIAETWLLGGRPAEAEQAYRVLIAVDPCAAQAYVNLGAIASKAAQHQRAATFFRRALRLDPQHAGAWNNMASALWETNDGVAAVASCRRSVALEPGHPDACANLGYLLRSQALSGRDFAAAETMCRRALQLRPSHLPACNNLGIILLDTGRLEEAEARFRQTLKAAPNHADARFNLALALLKAGRLAEAWDYYEARWETGQLTRPVRGGRPWRGEPLNGATIVLYAEQGHGDTLHFVRYVPQVVQRGGRVIVVVQPALKKLVGMLPGLADVHGFGEPIPAPDFHCALLSLPGIFGTDLATIPAGVPYLFPPLDRIAEWLDHPLPEDGLRVGLVWSGDSRPGQVRAHLTDRRRSMSLRDFAPLAGIGGVHLVSLQMGAPAAQLADTATGMRLLDPMRRVRDFADTAALVSQLDLVITVDTSVAHLAGALGKPVWVLSRYDGCWRWLKDRSDSPWYPTMRLFHQASPGDWCSAVAEVATALSQLAAVAPCEACR